MYTICGATGNIGGAIAEKLLKKGHEVRVIGRSEERLKPFAAKGAEIAAVDLRDTNGLARAFSGAKAVYAMIPPNTTPTDFRAYQNEIGKSIADAVRKAGVKYVVNLSSVGAHMSDGVGVVNGLYDQEQRLNELDGVNVLHLRPTFFMENHLWQIEPLKKHGIMATPQNPDVPVPQIATSDIADYAVKRLADLDFDGKVVRELLGPADISMNDAAASFGRAIGKEDLKYTRISYQLRRCQEALRGHGSIRGRCRQND
jgi:uncharacterized protein YbjT (DUF2867 family)